MARADGLFRADQSVPHSQRSNQLLLPQARMSPSPRWYGRAARPGGIDDRLRHPNGRTGAMDRGRV